MEIFFGVIAVIAIVVAIICATKKKKIDTATEIKNKRIAADNENLSDLNIRLREESDNLDKTVAYLSVQKRTLDNEISSQAKHLDELEKTIQSSLTNQQAISEQAFKNWWKILENKYQEKEIEYNQLSENLENAYTNKQNQLIAETEGYEQDLAKIRATRDAALSAQKKEKEIKEQLDFYCLHIPQADLEDAAKLENIKPSLHAPRILSMLIWQTYWAKPLKALSANVLGNGDVCGIYKITNQKTGECYIGQARDVRVRWSEHAKAGLGIDTPAANKLYKAMQDYGLQSFSWELLEACPVDQLNEKEKFYIELYDSYNNGYNSNKGISK